MSRATVRNAIVSYLENADIYTLNSVKPFPAKFTPEMEFYQGEDPGVEHGTILYIFFESQQEHRIEMGGHHGRKAVEYSVVFDCLTRSQAPQSEVVGEAASAFIDSLVAAIRADFQAGAPNVIFQWGEGTIDGGTDIDVVSYYPRALRGSASATQVYSRVRLTVVELLEA